MKQMKLFHGNYDGRNERAVVCDTKTRAMELLGVSAKTWKIYFRGPVTEIRPGYEPVWQDVGVVFERLLSPGPGPKPWRKVEQKSTTENTPKMTQKSKKPTKPADLSDSYWAKLTDRDKALYEIIRPVAKTTYEVNVRLSNIEAHLEGQQADMEAMGGALELDPDYQRGHVWTHEQRVRYMESFLRGRAPSLILFNCPGWSPNKATGDIPQYHLQCIDGLQRLTTFRMFMRDEVRVFGDLTASALFGTPFDPRRMGFIFGVYEFTTRAELLQFYLDLNSGGTVHAEEELARVRGLLVKATS